jgi:hypothetical protein
MLKQLCMTSVLGACAAITGCATIVHNGPRQVSVASTPPGAKVSIYDRSNRLVQVSTTPFVATLPTKFAYFKGQDYRLVFELPAYATAEMHLQTTVSRWYFGNFLFGGMLGLVIVDPSTGAMYNLTPDKVDQPLTAAQAELIRN